MRNFIFRLMEFRLMESALERLGAAGWSQHFHTSGAQTAACGFGGIVGCGIESAAQPQSTGGRCTCGGRMQISLNSLGDFARGLIALFGISGHHFHDNGVYRIRNVVINAFWRGKISDNMLFGDFVDIGTFIRESSGNELIKCSAEAVDIASGIDGCAGKLFRADILRGTEHLVADLLRESCAFLNQRTPPGMKISYWHVDFADIAKHSSVENPLLHDILSRYARSSMEFPRFHGLTDRSTGFFASYISQSARRHAQNDETPGPLSDSMRSALLHCGHLEQRGVLRSNCIDCLDRTNVAQFFLSYTAVYRMLFTLGIVESPESPDTSPLQQILVEMYKDLGDVISLQYGGSNAHDKIDVTRGNKKKKDFLTTILRHYNNAFTDKVKQESINIFLGVVDPLKHAQIISITNAKPNYDYYLHNRGFLQNETVAIHSSATWWQAPVVSFEQAVVSDLPAWLQACPALDCPFCGKEPIVPSALCCAFCGSLLRRRLPALHRGSFYAPSHETGLVCEQLIQSEKEWKLGKPVSRRTQLCELDRLLSVPCLIPHYLSTVWRCRLIG